MQFKLLCSPWGNEIEFKGDWSKKSTIWNILSISNRNKLLNQVNKPGQFW